MAKASLEMAVLDAELRAAGRSFAEHLGAVRDRVPAGVSVGITDTVGELLDQVAGYLDDGYLRIKLKIEPGVDIDRVAAVRERFGDDLTLQVDANAAYSLDDAAHLAQLDAFDLLLIEQPLATDDLRHHSLLATRMRTPICLDESITVGQGVPPTPSPSAPARSSTSRPAGSAATSRPCASTTCARCTAFPSGAAGCSRPGWAAPPTWRSPRCPGSPSPATRRRRTATGSATSPSRSCSGPTATSPCRAVPGWASNRSRTCSPRSRRRRRGCRDRGGSPPVTTRRRPVRSRRHAVGVRARHRRLAGDGARHGRRGCAGPGGAAPGDRSAVRHRAGRHRRARPSTWRP